MKRPIKNEDTEAIAQKLAAAVRAADRRQYEAIRNEHASVLDAMVRWEARAFMARVRYLAEGDTK